MHENDNAASLMVPYAASLPMMLQACKRVADKDLDDRAATMVLLAWWDTDALRELLNCIGALNGPTCVQGALLHALHKLALDNRYVKLDAKIINDAKVKAKAGLLVQEVAGNGVAASGYHTKVRKSSTSSVAWRWHATL